MPQLFHSQYSDFTSERKEKEKEKKRKKKKKKEKKKRLKFSRYKPGVAQRVGRRIALLFHDHGTRRGRVVSSMTWLHFTPGKEPVPILQEVGWAENLVCTGIWFRTVQPVVSHYTDWATQPTSESIIPLITSQQCILSYKTSTLMYHVLIVTLMVLLTDKKIVTGKW